MSYRSRSLALFGILLSLTATSLSTARAAGPGAGLVWLVEAAKSDEALDQLRVFLTTGENREQLLWFLSRSKTMDGRQRASALMNPEAARAALSEMLEEARGDVSLRAYAEEFVGNTLKFNRIAEELRAQALRAATESPTSPRVVVRPFGESSTTWSVSRPSVPNGGISELGYPPENNPPRFPVHYTWNDYYGSQILNVIPAHSFIYSPLEAEVLHEMELPSDTPTWFNEKFALQLFDKAADSSILEIHDRASGRMSRLMVPGEVLAATIASDDDFAYVVVRSATGEQSLIRPRLSHGGLQLQVAPPRLPYKQWRLDDVMEGVPASEAIRYDNDHPVRGTIKQVEIHGHTAYFVSEVLGTLPAFKQDEVWSLDLDHSSEGRMLGAYNRVGSIHLDERGRLYVSQGIKFPSGPNHYGPVETGAYISIIDPAKSTPTRQYRPYDVTIAGFSYNGVSARQYLATTGNLLIVSQPNSRVLHVINLNIAYDFDITPYADGGMMVAGVRVTSDGFLEVLFEPLRPGVDSPAKIVRFSLKPAR